MHVSFRLDEKSTSLDVTFARREMERRKSTTRQRELNRRKTKPAPPFSSAHVGGGRTANLSRSHIRGPQEHDLQRVKCRHLSQHRIRCPCQRLERRRQPEEHGGGERGVEAACSGLSCRAGAQIEPGNRPEFAAASVSKTSAARPCAAATAPELCCRRPTSRAAVCLSSNSTPS